MRSWSPLNLQTPPWWSGPLLPHLPDGQKEYDKGEKTSGQNIGPRGNVGPALGARHMTLPRPPNAASEMWRSECAAVDREMERLIVSAWPRTQEEVQVRKFQFAALVERRNDAARHFLAEAAVPRRKVKGPGDPTDPIPR